MNVGGIPMNLIIKKSILLLWGVVSLQSQASHVPERLLAQEESEEIATVSDELLTEIYQWESPKLLYIPQERFFDIGGEIKFVGPRGESITLQELFKGYHIISDDNMFFRSVEKPKLWNDEHWNEAKSVLSKRATGQEEQEKPLRKFQKKITVDELPSLLYHAKIIIKSFLSDLPTRELTSDKFIKKSGNLDRLFTYAQLRRVIKEKKLSHIHLPLKVLVIEDKNNGEYLDAQAASIILDDIIIISAYPSCTVDAKIHYYSQNYKLIIFAARQKKEKVSLSQAAYEDLEALVAEAPFDVGYDNIFSNAEGDAVIIDTEFKGEPARTSVQKLARYLPRKSNK